MNKLKILMLSQGLPFPVYRDGLTIRVYHLLKEFSKRAECHLISFADYSLSEEEIKSLQSIASYDIVSHVPSGGLWGTLKKILSKARYYSKSFEEKIEESTRTFKPDVVVAEQTFMSQYADAVKDIPKVMSAVDAISLAAIRQSEIDENFLMNLSWKYVAYQRLGIEKKYFKKFDRITVVGEDDAEFLRTKLKKDVQVIPNGVDREYFAPSFRSDNRQSIIFTGNLSSPMNEEACLYLLQRIFPIIHTKYKHVNLTIAGRSPSDKIKSATPPYITIKADVPDMRDVMRDAMICVSPIMYGTGIKNNVLQAMAMGIPVLTTPLIADPIRIIHNDTGIVAKRDSAFLEAIETALENPSLLDKIGENGRLHVEKNFSWEHVASRYMDMFAEVVDERK